MRHGDDQHPGRHRLANPGDTIEVCAGTYDEQLTVGKQLDIVGSTGAVVQPTTAPAAGVPDVAIDAANVAIRQLTFDFNGPDNGRGGLGIFVSNEGGPATTGVTISDNEMTTGDGSCEVVGCGTAIQTGKNADVSDLSITGNQIHGDADGMGEGIYVNPGPGTGIVIDGNTIDGNLYAGISVEASKVTVSENDIQDTSEGGGANAGIRVIDLSGNSHDGVSLVRNRVQDMDRGLYVGTKNGTTLRVSASNNELLNNEYGIYVYAGASLTAHDNAITDNATHNLYLTGSGQTVDASRNWWGSDNPTAVNDTIQVDNGSADFTPLIGLGTDTSDAFGFQPSDQLHVAHPYGSQTPQRRPRCDETGATPGDDRACTGSHRRHRRERDGQGRGGERNRLQRRPHHHDRWADPHLVQRQSGAGRNQGSGDPDAIQLPGHGVQHQHRRASERRDRLRPEPAEPGRGGRPAIERTRAQRHGDYDHRQPLLHQPSG